MKKLLIMAKIELSPLIKSMSGTISRKRLSDGTTVAYVVTKKNRLYLHATQPRVKPLSGREVKQRMKFGLIASASRLVKQQMELPSEPDANKKLWCSLGQLYELMLQHAQVITPQKLADSYCAFLV